MVGSIAYYFGGEDGLFEAAAEGFVNDMECSLDSNPRPTPTAWERSLDSNPRPTHTPRLDSGGWPLRGAGSKPILPPH